MIHPGTVWSILQRHIPKRQWVSAQDVYTVIESYATLDGEDQRPQSPLSKIPRWKILVRNVLVNREKKGKILWRKGADAIG